MCSPKMCSIVVTLLQFKVMLYNDTFVSRTVFNCLVESETRAVTTVG